MAEDRERESDQTTTTTWGTWEELLLACAVRRHGSKDWNSVAMEVQARCSLPHLLTTARNCEHKFHDLKRRFTPYQNDAVANLEGQNGVRIGDKVDNNVPWLDELRKLRVAELRQEVQRYDDSIHSLQLKVKRLEQEREQGLEDREMGTGKSDLKTESRELRSENDKRIFGEPHRSEPKMVVPGEDSDREDLSVNQSNSSGSKSGNGKSSAENGKSETKPEIAGSYRSEQTRRDSEPIGPHSDDGSTDTLVKNPTSDILETKMEKETRVDNSSELGDSAAQSNEGEEATRESSEVQSSASLTGKMKRKRLLRKEISGGSSGNGPLLTETVKSRQFSEVLQIIRAQKHSSLFESRLQSQETEEYKGMVRQHLDLETVQAKINSGSYSSSGLAFYRDLLLLCNNAVIFFPRFSNESMAAHELRLLISSELKKSQQVVPTDPSPEAVDLAPSIPSKTKGPIERPDSLLAKQKSSAPIIVCRKRSSISAKLSSTSVGDKGDRSNDDEKAAINLKSTVKMASNAVEEHGFMKDSKVKEKLVTGARSWRRSSDSLTNSSGPSVKKQNTNASWKPNSASKTETLKPDKKKPETVTLEKKRSAADFLKRIKQNSPAETLKRNSGRGGGGSSSSGNNAGGEQKKGGGKGDKGKERVSRQSNDKRRQKEDSSPSKRSVGRPPKKTVEANPVSTKRAREGGGKEPLKRPRKRSRR